MEEEAIRSTPRIVLIPSPGMGHLIPIIELAKLLRRRQNVSFTIITLPGVLSETEQSFLATLPASITHLPLDHVPAKASTVAPLFSIMKQVVPSVRTALLSLRTSTSLLAVITDLLSVPILPVAKELHIPACILYTTTFMHLSLFLHLPSVYSTEPLIRLPGCIPFAREHLIDPVRDPNHPLNPLMFVYSELFHEADVILVNSFEAIEPGACRALQGKPSVYPIGPLVRSDDDRSAECLKWLEQQSVGSVVFVSFGSMWELSVKQTEELAFGLEMSGHRFLWVVRGGGGGGNPLKLLPEGFIERTSGVQGMVVPGWAPQAAVLSSGAVGGFVTHCGWNSALESLVHGVPMVAWPLQHDQMMNAVLLVEGLGVALRPTAAIKEGVVGREALCEAVRELMEGERGRTVRARVRDIQEAALEAASEEGPSAKVLASIVALWKNKIQRESLLQGGGLLNCE